MNITGVGTTGNPYAFSAKNAGTEKAETARARFPHKDTVRVSEPEGAAYYEALRQNFSCVKNGGVSISGAYLDKCARDPELAKRLEENLAAYEDCVRQGYENAKLSAQAAGGRLLSYSETWSIDGEGSLTMISRGTVEYETGTKTWEEIRKDTLERLEKAREKKEKQEAAASEEDGGVSQRQGGKVAVNQMKRARQIAAAKCQDDVRQVIALLHQDMADCKAGLEKGWCDGAEIAKVQALLSSAQARLSQVPKEAENELGISEFDLAGLL